MMSPTDFDQHGWPKSKPEEARAVGCRVMHYRDARAVPIEGDVLPD